MASTSSNRLIPVLGALVVIIVVVVVYKQFTGGKPTAGDPLKTIPTPTEAKLPGVGGADNDNPAETLRTVTTSNEELRRDVARVIEMNNKLISENKRLGGSNATVAHTAEKQQADTNLSRGKSIDPSGDESGAAGAVDKAISRTNDAVDTFSRAFSLGGARSETEAANAAASKMAAVKAAPRQGQTGGAVSGASTTGSADVDPDGYRTLTPMGYSAVTDTPKGGSGANAKGPAMTRYVRTSGNDVVESSMIGAGPSARVAPPANVAAKPTAKPAPIPYFTVPENATLVGVTSMTSLIGRVPIDGRVTDPMQFKAIVGRDNLAANGFELPPDLEGMIITGIAIGDMALSCSEGKIRSVTFVFNDGTVRTISQRNRGGGSVSMGNGGGFGGAGQDLGFISDEFGNPCITGKFITNAPSYLADLAMLKGLDVAAQAYADAQRTVSNNLQTGSTSSTITGNRGGYAMAQAASGATDEIVRWMTSRLKNSFDAVITPAGRQLVVHLDKELQIDKMPDARKLVYRQQGGRQLARGEHYGLE